MLTVSQTFRPQTVYVSQLFLQVASFALGKSVSTFGQKPTSDPHIY